MKTIRLFEYLSAMQKSIRRNLVEDAGYWFFALAEDGHFMAAINRLKITAYEDIGTGDIVGATFALRCVDDAITWHKTNKNAWRLAAANAIIALSNANKSRAADHFQAICRGRYHQNPKHEVPDWALDKHTVRGKKKGRGFDHFRQEGAKLVPPNTDKWEEEAYSYWKGILNPTIQDDIDRLNEPTLF